MLAKMRGDVKVNLVIMNRRDAEYAELFLFQARTRYKEN
jgi:hypothetical protein